MNKLLTPVSRAELLAIRARIDKALNMNVIHHQGLLLEPAKTPVKHGVFAWPAGKLVPGQRFQYTRTSKWSKAKGRTFWYVVGSDGKAVKDPSQFTK